jgi:hypothetical protein
VVVELTELRDLVVRANRTLLGPALASEGRTQNFGEVVHGGERDYSPRGPRSLHDHHRGERHAGAQPEADAQAKNLTYSNSTPKPPALTAGGFSSFYALSGPA